MLIGTKNLHQTTGIFVPALPYLIYCFANLSTDVMQTLWVYSY